MGSCSQPVARLGADASRLLDPSESSGQHPCPIAQQARVGGIANVGFDYRSVDAGVPPRYQPAFARRLDQALMDRFDAIWTNHESLITVLASGTRSK
jgi:hypothetical protein